jgi:hypothetical protein
MHALSSTAPAQRSTTIWLPVCVALICGAMTSGCAQWRYDETKLGKELAGRLIVEWVEPDHFIYRPDAKTPLTFITSDGRVIVPREMKTDGGSIPRLFWSVPGFSPWGLAPGYIVHDWLFVQQHCKYDGYQQYSFEDSAHILAEAIKTQMETGRAPKDPTVLSAIYEAVSSPIARELWTNGKCEAPPPATALRARKRVLLLEIDMAR